MIITPKMFMLRAMRIQKPRNLWKVIVPRNVKFIKKFRGKIPLFHEHNIEKELNKIFEPTVKLKSGGYLVIVT